MLYHLTKSSFLALELHDFEEQIHSLTPPDTSIPLFKFFSYNSIFEMNIKSKCYIYKAYVGITNIIEDADLGDNLNFIKLSCYNYCFI